ncbi:ribosome-binding protein aMBF1 (putative translation factor) [Rhodoblastus acidophilus]|uniref:helix-turn-helix domain-containing protein n=1 Tax=Rhodoblastus acidophilus TaxID=1074 RepID=UPI0029CAB2AE|nr:helix-turn-helix domain-containing protein [Rhodoblastus acidophilus]MCW2286811.1 ribosome-binding protein aMBF1 (putative translation factor) [Rhodoblastus acidophilus]MCW2335664.1 ribosome-binding protein aMBF1 (putative translation factor) [Rhodoblastus acidophilus]
MQKVFQSFLDGSGEKECVMLSSGMMTPAQCRAARGLLDWSQKNLAEAARVGVVTVRQFESAAATPRNATMEAMQRALEAAGVEFIPANGSGAGVRLKKGIVQ